MRIEVNRRQLAEVQAMVSGISDNAPKILARSLNSTVSKGKTLSSKKIREQVSLKAQYVNSKLSVNKATWHKLSASISAASRGVLMTRYPHTVLKRGGATVKIKRSGARKKLPGAFKTIVYAGKEKKRVEVLAVPKAGRYKNGHRKIEVLYSPSVSQVFDDTRNQVMDELNDYLLEQVEKQLSADLRGY